MAVASITAQILILKGLLEIEKRLKEEQRMKFKEYQKQQAEKEKKHPIQKDEVVAKFIDDYMDLSEKDIT